MAVAEQEEPFDEFVAALETDLVKLQESLIAEKVAMMQAVAEEVGWWSRRRDALKNPGERFDVTHIIAGLEAYIAELGRAIDFNREVINAVRSGSGVSDRDLTRTES